MDSEHLDQNYQTLLRGHLMAGKLHAFNAAHAAARRALPGFRLELDDLDLHGRDLKSIDLRNADLTCTDLESCVLDNADLTNADLTGAHARGATLKHATLYYARAENADFSAATLTRANMEGIFAKHANFSAATMRQANLNRAYLIGSDVRGTDLTRATLKEALFAYVNAEGAILERAQMGMADTRGTDLLTAHIKDAQLSKAIFSTWDDILAARKAGAKIAEDRDLSNLDTEELARHYARNLVSNERYTPLDRDQPLRYGQREWHEKLQTLAHGLKDSGILKEEPYIENGEILYPQTGLRIRAAEGIGPQKMERFAKFAKRFPALAAELETPFSPSANAILGQIETHLNPPEPWSGNPTHDIRLFFGRGLAIEALEEHEQSPKTRQTLQELEYKLGDIQRDHAPDPVKAYEAMKVQKETGTLTFTNEAFGTLMSALNKKTPARNTPDQYPSLRDLSDPLPAPLGAKLENEAGVRPAESERIR